MQFKSCEILHLFDNLWLTCDLPRVYPASPPVSTGDWHRPHIPDQIG